MTDAHSEKYSIVQAAKYLLTMGIKERFPTYDAAIAEIDRLQHAVNQLESAYKRATYKRTRGRPAGNPIKKKILQDFPLLSEWIRRRAPVAKGGRPRKNTYQEMIDNLKEFDDKKQRYAKAKCKKRVTDKEYIEFQTNTDQKMKVWPEHRREEEIERFRQLIKYFREEVKKQKTP